MLSKALEERLSELCYYFEFRPSRSRMLFRLNFLKVVRSSFDKDRSMNDFCRCVCLLGCIKDPELNR